MTSSRAIGLLGCVAAFAIAFVGASRALDSRQSPASASPSPGVRAPAAADLVLRNGKIVTVDDEKAEAQALAVKGDTIIAVGSNEEILAFTGADTEVIDLDGQLAIPGFIEGHAHFTGIGRSKLILNLTKTRSWDEIVAMVADAASRARPGEWIVGRGWHQEKWDRTPVPSVEGFPTHASLDAASPDNPVVLTHASGHATFVNARAMVLSRITRETKNPAGGEIMRDTAGDPTGLLRERASDLIDRAEESATPTPAQMRPARMAQELRRIVALANQECLSKGITTVQDAGSSFETIDVLRKIDDEGGLGVRLWVMVREVNEKLAQNLARYRTVGTGNRRLTIRAIKVSIDGALGSRGAWLLEPYADKPDSTGLMTTPVASVAETARLAIQHGYQLCVHAIGDRANRETLNIYEQTFKAHPDKTDLRWRIEHAQHLNGADIPRFRQLGVIASMQGIHSTSDAPFVVARLGAARAEEGAYVWQKLLKSGVLVSNGTDAPVEDVDPIANYYASVTRRLDDGRTFYSEQRMTRMEALKSYTLNAAYAAFEDDIKGSLRPGKLADITVLSQDILTVPDDRIRSTEVVYTIVGGKIAYRKES